MKEAVKLTRKQLDFIDDLITGDCAEAALLKDHGISRRIYRRWLCQEAFVEELRQGIDGVRHRNMLKIARHVPAAVDGLAKMVAAEGELGRKACLDLLALQGSQGTERAGAAGPQNITRERAATLLEALAREEAG